MSSHVARQFAGGSSRTSVALLRLGEAAAAVEAEARRPRFFCSVADDGAPGCLAGSSAVSGAAARDLDDRRGAQPPRGRLFFLCASVCTAAVAMARAAGTAGASGARASGWTEAAAVESTAQARVMLRLARIRGEEAEEAPKKAPHGRSGSVQYSYEYGAISRPLARRASAPAPSSLRVCLALVFCRNA